MLVGTVSIASLLAGLTLCSRSVDSIRITSFDCGQGRTIHLYEDSFCEVATTPDYDVEINNKIVAAKYSTGLGFMCGERIDADSFRLVADETTMLFAVLYNNGGTDIIALIYDFEMGLGIPRSDFDHDIPLTYRNQLQLQGVAYER